MIECNGSGLVTEPFFIVQGIRMILINGQQVDTVAFSDRAFQYGDGVFTTVLMKNGQACDWSRHKARLEQNVSALHIEGVDWSLVYQWVDTVANALKGTERAILKVIVSRGSGGRGYSAAGCNKPTVTVSSHPFPTQYLSWRETGISLSLLEQCIGQSPLAGLKHLNRLEQVLLKREVENSGTEDGVACDMNGHVIETSASNIFWRIDQTLYTPLLTTSGVAGTMRAQVISVAQALGYATKEVLETPDSLLNADEIFITNAVMGVVPVHCLEGKNYRDFDASSAIALRLDV